MNTKEYLKSELDKIDKNIYSEIDGYGNVEYVIKVMELYAQVVNKNDLLPDVSQRSELACSDIYHKHCYLSTMQYKFCPMCGVDLKQACG